MGFIRLYLTPHALFSGRTEEDVFHRLLHKLGRPSHDDFIAALHPDDRDAAREIIEACFRRAIFTRMDSEIDLGSMYDSINKAVGAIQRVSPLIQDPHLQFAALKILRSLDEIERMRRDSKARASYHLEPEQKKFIDAHKLEIIRLLLEMRRAAALPIQLPLTLRTDHFFRLEEANQVPTLEVS